MDRKHKFVVEVKRDEIVFSFDFEVWDRASQEQKEEVLEALQQLIDTQKLELN